jgi:hypothetical protein
MIAAFSMSTNELSPSQRAGGRDELDTSREELAIHYNQLKALDDHLYQYTSVFFTINVGLLAFLAQLLNNDKQVLDPLVYLFITFMGYTSAVCIFLIAWKGYLSWEIQSERVRVLEARLGYHISDWPPHSHTYKHNWAARHLSIARVRWVFNLLLALIWVVLVIAFPRLTDIGTSNLYYCLYPCLIPALVVVPMGIMFGPLLINEFKKGRSSNDQYAAHLW